MFKKQHRITSRDFSEYFKIGTRFSSPIGHLIYTPTDMLQVAVVVPKKVITTAVGRNRIRRQIYNEIKPLLEHKTGAYIFICNKNIRTTSIEERRKILTEIIGRNTKAR